jgi:hypothetical protein
MKKFTLFSLLVVAQFMLALMFAQDKSKIPTIASVSLVAPNPIVKVGCTTTSAGYVRYSKQNDEVYVGFSPSRTWTDEEYNPSDVRIGRWIRQQMAKGVTVSLYPDEGGIFATTACQK